MSTPEPQAPARAKRTTSGKFAVLHEVKSIEDLAAIFADGEMEVFVVLERDVTARTAHDAIRMTAKVDTDEVRLGRYVGVPMKNFQPRNVRSFVHLVVD